MYWNKMVPSDAPTARAASTNSLSFTVSTAALAILAYFAIPDTARARSRLKVLVPRAATMAMANSM